MVLHDHLGFGLSENLLVVHTRKDDRSRREVGLVFLPLLDRALVPVEVLERGEPLAHLLPQVAVRHRVADDRHLPVRIAQDLRHAAGGLALPASGPDGAHRDHGTRAREHRLTRAEQAEGGAGRAHPGGAVHHVLVRDVGVGERHHVDPMGLDQLVQLLLGMDRDPVGIPRTGQLGGVAAPVDIRNLRGGEGDDLDVVAFLPVHVEVVEVAAGGPHDEHSGRPGGGHGACAPGSSSRPEYVGPRGASLTPPPGRPPPYGR